MSVGFLGVNAAGEVGVDITMQEGFSHTSWDDPDRIILPIGTVYRIVDTQGRELIYVKEWFSAEFSSASATEYLTMEQAECRFAPIETLLLYDEAA